MYACEKLRREDRTRLFEKLKMNNAQALDEEVMSLVSVVPVVQSKALAMLQLLDASYRLVTHFTHAIAPPVPCCVRLLPFFADGQGV